MSPVVLDMVINISRIGCTIFSSVFHPGFAFPDSIPASLLNVAYTVPDRKRLCYDMRKETGTGAMADRKGCGRHPGKRVKGRVI